MADSIDPEILRQINENLSAMSDMIGRTNSTMGDFAKTMQGMGNASKQNTDATNQNTTAQKNVSAGATALADAEKEAAEQLATEAANLKRAMGSAVGSLGSFGDAILSGQKGFSKYNSALGQAGDAALALGKNFGILGIVAGGLVKAFTMVQQAVNKQLDDQVNFRDNLSKSGSALGQSVDKLAGLGRAAGYASGDLEKLVKPLQTAGSQLVALGGSAGEGASKFLEVANVGGEVRKEFKNLGMSYEELTQNQADYLAQQQLSVIALKSETIGRETLKNASLEYTENLVKLSALTGKNADQLKQEQLVNQQKFEEVLKERQENVKIAKLRKEGKDKEADDILSQQQARKALINRVTAEQGEAAGAAVGQIARTGTINKDTAKYATQTGINPAEEKKKIESTKAAYDAEGKLDLAAAEKQGDAYGRAASNKIGEATDKQTQSLGDTIGIAGQAAAKNLLIGDKDTVQRGSAQAGMTAEERDAQRAKIDEDVKKGKEGKDSEGKDDEKSQKAANLQETEIKARIRTDDLINIASNHMTALTVALGAATLAIGGLALAMRGKGVGIGEGFLGKMSNPLGGLMGGKGGKVATGGATEGILGAAGGVEKAAAGTLPTLTKAAEGGAGKSVGGFIEGIGDGLAAVGKKAPMVLAGAGAVGGAITLIGAGVAGATWILGAALPKFAEGLESFNDVDGENLKQAGLGMVGLGAGIVALGAGAALNAMTGLSRLFSGQEDPLTEAGNKLKDFQALDIDKDKVKNNADAFVAFSKAMSEYKGGATAGTASSSISQSIYKFFKAEPPTKQFENFAKLSIDPAATTKNAKAFVDFANAMSSYKGGPGGFTALSSLIGAGVTKLFGGDGPVAAFKKFSEMDFGDKADKNATAFKNYAESMGILSGASGGGGGGGKATEGSGAAGIGAGSSGGGGSSGSSGGGGSSGSSGGGTGANGGSGGTAGGGAGSGAADTGSSSSSRFTNTGEGESKSSSAGGAGGSGDKKNAGGANSVSGKGPVISGENDVKAMIKQHEGVRNKPYKDSLGLWTVGVGHLIGDGHSLPGNWNKSFTDEEVNSLFEEDYFKHKKAAEKIPGFSKLKSQGQGALTDLTFNMGPSWYTKWPNFTKQLEQGDTAGAADNLLNSTYAKQVGKRAQDNAGLLKAKAGGMFDGPKTGYPIEMHGSELVAPLNPDSILMKLAKEPAKPEAIASATKAPDMGKALNDMVHMMSIKLDKVVSVLENSHKTNEKILKRTSV